MSPHEVNMAITSVLVLLLIVYMGFVVLYDLIIPSQVSRFGVVLIGGVLLGAPLVFVMKNIFVLFAYWNL